MCCVSSYLRECTFYYGKTWVVRSSDGTNYIYAVTFSVFFSGLFLNAFSH